MLSLTPRVEDIVEEVVKAIIETVKLKDRGFKPAAIQDVLKSGPWKYVKPISVGDDYSIVLKVPHLRPCDKDYVQAEGLGEVVEPIRNFPLVIRFNGSYVAIGSSAMRVSLNVPGEALERIIKLCFKH